MGSKNSAFPPCDGALVRHSLHTHHTDTRERTTAQGRQTPISDSYLGLLRVHTYLPSLIGRTVSGHPRPPHPNECDCQRKGEVECLDEPFCAWLSCCEVSQRDGVGATAVMKASDANLPKNGADSTAPQADKSIAVRLLIQPACRVCKHAERRGVLSELSYWFSVQLAQCKHTPQRRDPMFCRRDLQKRSLRSWPPVEKLIASVKTSF